MTETTKWPEWDSGKIAIAIMGSAGDTKTVWDKNNDDEVENARATFDRLKGKGYAAFKVQKDGSPGEQMHSFDPDAERMIMIPQMQGG